MRTSSTRGALFLAVGGLVLVGGSATAEEATPDEPAGAEPRLLAPAARPSAGRPGASGASGGDGYSHQGQVQVSLRLALGLRAIVPWDKGTYCGDTDSSTSSGNAPVCTGRAPFSLDFEIGYGLTPRIDILLETRIGIESDFATTAFAMGGPRMFHLSPGARFFFSDSKRSKLFTTAQAVFDFAGYSDPSGAGRGADLGVRNLNGIWFDLDPAYGFYAYVGETLTLSRWLRFELEAGIGIQGRYP